jgi:hypothetical protein
MCLGAALLATSMSPMADLIEPASYREIEKGKNPYLKAMNPATGISGFPVPGESRATLKLSDWEE